MPERRSVPLACALGPEEMRERRALARDLVRDRGARVEHLGDGTRRRFQATPGLAVALARLIELERACCPFFGFRMTIDADGVALEVTAPSGAVDLAHAFGEALASPQGPPGPSTLQMPEPRAAMYRKAKQ